MTLLSQDDFHAMAGTCRDCGAQVAHYVCNDGLIGVRPTAAEHDWWMACTDPACAHHHGEGVFQESPAWLLPTPPEVWMPGPNLSLAPLPVEVDVPVWRSLSNLLALADRMDNPPAAAPLRAFWVGEHDVYAAHSAEQALELCEGHSGMPDTFDLDDVRELTADELDKPLQEEDGTPCGTTRQMLADKAAPGELVSFE